MVKKKIAVLAGDGIGPEIIREGIKVLEPISNKYGHQFTLIYAPFGAQSYFDNGSPFPEMTKKNCDIADAILKGPIGLNLEGMKKLKEAGVDIEKDSVLALRKRYDTFTNYRPVILPKSCADFSPLKKEVIGDGIDILMMRELVGGIYFGEKVEGEQTNMQYAKDDCTYTREQIERFANVCFQEARKKGSKLTNVHKKNVLATGRFWNAIFEDVAKQYSDVKLESMLVDNVAFQLVKNPVQFNGVMAFENMQGDIETDEGAGVLGSLGLMPSACFNPETNNGIYEPAHGSAPDIAGMNIANPYAMIGSVAFMLEKSFGLNKESQDIWNALTKVFSLGYRTKELATKDTLKNNILSTSRFGDKVKDEIYRSISEK